MASVAHIAALGPELLVVEKSVARVAQEALLDQVGCVVRRVLASKDGNCISRLSAGACMTGEACRSWHSDAEAQLLLAALT